MRRARDNALLERPGSVDSDSIHGHFYETINRVTTQSCRYPVPIPSAVDNRGFSSRCTDELAKELFGCTQKYVRSNCFAGQRIGACRNGKCLNWLKVKSSRDRLLMDIVQCNHRGSANIRFHGGEQNPGLGRIVSGEKCFAPTPRNRLVLTFAQLNIAGAGGCGPRTNSLTGRAQKRGPEIGRALRLSCPGVCETRAGFSSL